MLKFTFILFVVLILSYTSSLSAEKDSLQYHIDLYHSVIESDSSNIDELLQCKQYFEEEKDSIWLIKSLVGLSKHHSRLGNYNASFTDLWKALYIAESLNNEKLLFEVHTQLGTMFYIFDKDEETLLHHTEALSYAKQAHRNGSIKLQSTISAYYNLVHYYRKIGEYNRSLAFPL